MVCQVYSCPALRTLVKRSQTGGGIWPFGRLARCLLPARMRRETGRPRRHEQGRERAKTGERPNTAPGGRKSFLLRGVDTERKGCVSRPLQSHARKDIGRGASSPGSVIRVPCSRCAEAPASACDDPESRCEASSGPGKELVHSRLTDSKLFGGCARPPAGALLNLGSG